MGKPPFLTPGYATLQTLSIHSSVPLRGFEGHVLLKTGVKHQTKGTEVFSVETQWNFKSSRTEGPAGRSNGSIAPLSDH